MATKHDSLGALAQICRNLGGQLVLVSRQEFCALVDADDEDDLSLPGTEGSRFEYAIHWEKKIVYAVRGTAHIGFVIHEAGHVFADLHPPDDDACDEWAWLGWEIVVARQIGVWRAWTRQNSNYHLGDGTDDGIGKDKAWCDLSAKERRAVIDDRLAHARKIGVVDADGNPRSLR